MGEKFEKSDFSWDGNRNVTFGAGSGAPRAEHMAWPRIENRKIPKHDSAKDLHSSNLELDESRLVAIIDVPLDFPVGTFGQLGTSFGQLVQVLPFPSYMLTRTPASKQLLAVVLVFDDLKCAVSFYEYLKAHASLLNLHENQIKYGSPSAFRFLLNGSLESQGELFISGYPSGKDALWKTLSAYGPLRLLRTVTLQEEKAVFEHISKSPRLLDLNAAATSSLLHSLLASQKRLQPFLAEFYSVKAAATAVKALSDSHPSVLAISNVYSLFDKVGGETEAQHVGHLSANSPYIPQTSASSYSSLAVQKNDLGHVSANNNRYQTPFSLSQSKAAASVSSTSDASPLDQFHGLTISGSNSTTHTPSSTPTPQASLGALERQQYLAKLKTQLMSTAVPTDVQKWSLGSSFPSGSGVAAKQHFIPRGNEVNLYHVIMGLDTRTTFMIRNIPNKYSQTMLMEFLDETHKGEYDFLYLRIDFRNQCNVGYAFINFIDVSSVITFAQKVVGKKWTRFNSDKLCMLSYANIQGKHALIEKFRNSSVMLEDATYRPKLFYSSGPLQGQDEPFPPPTVLLRRAQPLASSPAVTASAAPTSSQMMSAPSSPFPGGYHQRNKLSGGKISFYSSPNLDYAYSKAAPCNSTAPRSANQMAHSDMNAPLLAHSKGHFRSQSEILHSASVKHRASMVSDSPTLSIMSKSLHPEIMEQSLEVVSSNLH